MKGVVEETLGIIILVRSVQLLKAPVLIEVTQSGIVMLARIMQSLKA